MQIKTILRFHLTLDRMAKIKYLLILNFSLLIILCQIFNLLMPSLWLDKLKGSHSRPWKYFLDCGSTNKSALSMLNQTKRSPPGSLPQLQEVRLFQSFRHSQKIYYSKSWVHICFLTQHCGFLSYVSNLKIKAVF